MAFLSEMFFDPTSGPLMVRRVQLDFQGYTKDGKYFGTPNDLWKIMNDYGREKFIRARDLKMAKQIAKAMFPTATWTR